ncbi:unnamed protein product [Dovyalis caffra]|uniref:Uncharacterized protein n=1 Tax=Dovyalis caffra TaxID=77055 RepID=A0AAV1R6A2_9ROSI|nr:unnamed protein product [Dovyalis caffra]
MKNGLRQRLWSEKLFRKKLVELFDWLRWVHNIDVHSQKMLIWAGNADSLCFPLPASQPQSLSIHKGFPNQPLNSSSSLKIAISLLQIQTRS